MLGTVNPVAEIARRAHEVGAVVLVDGAQAVPQMPVDVQAAGVDFLVFTGSHKVTGPTGIGVLWGRRAISTAAAVPRRRRDDRHRVDGEVDVRRDPHGSGRHPTDRRGGRSRAAVDLAALGADNVRAHEEAITPPRSRASRRCRS